MDENAIEERDETARLGGLQIEKSIRINNNRKPPTQSPTIIFSEIPIAPEAGDLMNGNCSSSSQEYQLVQSAGVKGNPLLDFSKNHR